MDIPILREFILQESKDIIPKLSFPFDLEKTIDDFILMLFLCGNDFLPAIPTLDIGEGALNYFFGIYKDILPTLAGYITETHAGKRAHSTSDGEKESERGHQPEEADIIHFDRLDAFLEGLGRLEEPVLSRRAAHSKRDFDRKKFSRKRRLESQLRKQQNEERKTNVPKAFATTSSTTPKLQAGAQQFVPLPSSALLFLTPL